MKLIKTRVIFRRPNAYYRDFFRSYYIKIDGRLVGKIKRGQEVEVEVEPGVRNIRAIVDWAGSPYYDIEVKSGESIVVRVEPSSNPWEVWKALSTRKSIKLVVEDG